MISTLPLLAEFLGTFLLMLSILASAGNAFVVGGALALVILLITNLSGGYVNPAVTTTMYLKGSLSGAELLAYMVVQFLGATASFYAFNAFA